MKWYEYYWFLAYSVGGSIAMTMNIVIRLAVDQAHLRGQIAYIAKSQTFLAKNFINMEVP